MHFYYEDDEYRYRLYLRQDIGVNGRSSAWLVRHSFYYDKVSFQGSYEFAEDAMSKKAKEYFDKVLSLKAFW